MKHETIETIDKKLSDFIAGLQGFEKELSLVSSQEEEAIKDKLHNLIMNVRNSRRILTVTHDSFIDEFIANEEFSTSIPGGRFIIFNESGWPEEVSEEVYRRSNPEEEPFDEDGGLKAEEEETLDAAGYDDSDEARSGPDGSIFEDTDAYKPKDFDLRDHHYRFGEPIF